MEAMGNARGFFRFRGLLNSKQKETDYGIKEGRFGGS
jgi:hypothetical protein